MALTRAGIDDREAIVGVIGLGYIGLPLALTFAEAGFHVRGFDLDVDKPPVLAAGRSYLRHIADERVAAVAERLVASSELDGIAHCDAVLICVPTPLDEHLQPDLTFVEQTAEGIAPHLAPDTLVVLESTTWPGTTGEVLRPLLEQYGARCLGSDLYVAYSPEREDPGNADFGTRSIPKLVGGLDVDSEELAGALYAAAVATVIPVGDARVAEAAKLFENVFRSVNIALVNELKVILDGMGIDVWAVIRAAASKPFGFMPFWPGPGLGGHCIPIDPFYLSWKAREYGVHTRFIELAGEINRSMPRWVVGKVQDCLNEAGKAVKGSRILILGLSYKKDVGDLRESPSLELIEQLEARGAEVDYHDPFIEEVGQTRRHARLAGRRRADPGADYDCLLLATDHSCYDEALLAHAVPIVDCRGRLPEHPLVWRA